MHKHRRIATAELPEKSKIDRVGVVAPLLFGIYKGAETYSRISADRDRANEQLRTAQAAFRKAKRALETDTELANWRGFQRNECKTDASIPAVICNEGTSSKTYKMEDLDRMGQQRMERVISARDKVDKLTAEVGIKEDGIIVDTAGAVVGWAGIVYGLMGAIILFRKISSMIKRGIAQIKKTKDSGKGKKDETLIVASSGQDAPKKEPVIEKPLKEKEPRVKKTRPEPEERKPRPKTRPTLVPAPTTTPPSRVDVRIERTVRDSIEARFRTRAKHEATLIELAIGPLTTFVRDYIQYVDRPVGSRGTFALNGNSAGFREKWAVEGTYGFGDWRVFSCKINSTGRLVVMIDINQRRFGIYGVYSDHDKYTSDVAWFDPKNVRPSVEIAHL